MSPQNDLETLPFVPELPEGDLVLVGTHILEQVSRHVGRPVPLFVADARACAEGKHHVEVERLTELEDPIHLVRGKTNSNSSERSSSATGSSVMS